MKIIRHCALLGFTENPHSAPFFESYHTSYFLASSRNICPVQEIKLPVFFLYYDCGLGSEEITPEQGEEEEIEASSQRHKVTFKPVDKLKIIPSFQSVFDLYQNEAKTQTTQIFGLSITSTIDNVRVGGRYKGILRSSLGDESTVPLRSGSFSQRFCG